MIKGFSASAVVLVLAAVTLSTFVGCGQSDDLVFGQPTLPQSNSVASLEAALVGRWVREGKNIANSSVNMDLLRDKTGICDYGGDGKGAAMVWKVESGRFYEVYGTSGYVWNYKISGTTLTLTNGNGESTHYTRQP
jgi:hypothetical protein